MHKYRIRALIGAAAALAAGVTILTPQAALASTSDCSTTANVCWWNNGSYTGAPSGAYGNVPEYRANWNISDNILSSAISRYSSGDNVWCITNVEGVSNIPIGKLVKNVGLSFSGTQYDNKADDINFYPCNRAPL